MVRKPTVQQMQEYINACEKNETFTECGLAPCETGSKTLYFNKDGFRVTLTPYVGEPVEVYAGPDIIDAHRAFMRA